MFFKIVLLNIRSLKAYSQIHRSPKICYYIRQLKVSAELYKKLTRRVVFPCFSFVFCFSCFVYVIKLSFKYDLSMPLNNLKSINFDYFCYIKSLYLCKKITPLICQIHDFKRVFLNL